MAQVIRIKGKTEQRVGAIISVLKEANERFTYAQLSDLTGAPYDQLLYVLATLVETGQVERVEFPDGPGRPRVSFRWLKRGSARAMGAR